jgi:formyl-CoA transferase/CoA:oxalate CoA-transferase
MSAPAEVLDGVRVLDFTRVMAGPYATEVLADFGADVIKVESLPHGDGGRQFGVDYVGDQTTVFLMWNRGKRSLALDLHRPAALDVIHRMARGVDVVVENYRPGVADEIGVGYDQLCEINPRLVYCSISAFGSSGPLANLPGTDPVVQAASGIMSVTGERDGGPVMVGVPVADFTGAMLGVQGILLALLARERTGRGQRVDVSMLRGVLSMLTTRLASYWTTGSDPMPNGSAHSTLVPYQVFETATTPVMAGAWHEESWKSFVDAVDLPMLADDPRFATNVDRQRHRDELIPLVQAEFRKRPAGEWEKRFSAAGGLFARVNSFSDILEHPHVEQAGVVATMYHPHVGPIRQMTPPVQLSDTPGRLGAPPPLLGEHTEQVLRESGFSDEEIGELRRSGVALDHRWRSERGGN